MGYSFSDANNKTANFKTSVNGLREVKALMKEYQDWPKPALEQLIEEGHTAHLSALAFECTNLANKTNDKSIKGTLMALAAFAKNSSEVVFMSH